MPPRVIKKVGSNPPASGSSAGEVGVIVLVIEVGVGVEVELVPELLELLLVLVGVGLEVGDKVTVGVTVGFGVAVASSGGVVGVIAAPSMVKEAVLVGIRRVS